MGHREVRRVPLDFDWPTGRVWSGYLSPDWRPCPSDDCESGYTFAGRWLDVLTHLILMAGDAARRTDQELHPWLRDIPLAPTARPGADMAALTEGLAGRADQIFGHDSIDRSRAAAKIREAAGMPDTWGVCQICRGHSIHPDDIEASEAWQGTDPPEGDGWQLWETTSEGSPLSPVFPTAADLAAWCAVHATLFANHRWTAAQWLQSFLAGTTDVDSLMVSTRPVPAP